VPMPNFTVLRVLRLTRLFRLIKLGKTFEAFDIILRVVYRSKDMFTILAGSWPMTRLKASS
jgi:hypothetical protein